MENVALVEITVPAHRARGLDPAAVDRLADSIQRLGLQTPITLRYDTETDEILLVAGLHRLEAARKLGWQTIPAVYTEGDADQARMWEIAENLHRAELNVVERAEHIEEWRRLSAKVRNNSAPAGGAQPTESGVRQTARDLGVNEKTVRNAAKIANLPPEVKEQAKAEGWTQKQALAATAPQKPAPIPLNDVETEEAWLTAIMRVWNRGAREWRERFMAEVDRPVFDGG